MPLSILYVCTGNVCRSPAAELLTAAWVAPECALTASSAGMRALVGHGIDEGSATVLAQMGINPAKHRARQFEPWMAVDADLVLTAERSHRDEIMELVPAVYRRVFTIKEFVRLRAWVDATAPVDVVAAAAASRTRPGAVPLEDDDVPDPHRRSAAETRPVVEEVSAAVRSALDTLGFAVRPVLQRRPLPYPR